MDKKRGMSPIVATVLIVMLTIAGVAAIASFVIPFIKKNLESGSECKDYEDYFVFDESYRYNCYTGSGNNTVYGFSVKAKADTKSYQNLKGFVIVLRANDGTSKSYEIVNGSQAGEIKTCGKTKVELPYSGGIKTYGFRKENIVSAIIQTKLKSGKICKEADKIDFYRCEYSIGETLKTC
ncbi:MAG: hypothetical protein N3D20_00230 [Candidatus Pacearchaeota archaeon]|nr:hypothetical protein [Candidatus Pacearchaeota archaeon]